MRKKRKEEKEREGKRKEQGRQTVSLTFTTSHFVWKLQVIVNHPSLPSLQSCHSQMPPQYLSILTKLSKIYVLPEEYIYMTKS